MAEVDLTSYELDVLKDPRLAGMLPGEKRMFRPMPDPERKPFASRFLRLMELHLQPTPKWINRPRGILGWGMGRGLPNLEDKPVFLCQSTLGSASVPDAWYCLGFYVLSDRLVEVLDQLDRAATAHTPAEVRGADGAPLNTSYYLADFTRVLDAVDHAKSVVTYERLSEALEASEIDEDRKARSNFVVEEPFVLSSDIPQDVHAFRPGEPGHYPAGLPMFSRKLIGAIHKAGVRMSFRDVAIGGVEAVNAMMTLNDAHE